MSARITVTCRCGAVLRTTDAEEAATFHRDCDLSKSPVTFATARGCKVEVFPFEFGEPGEQMLRLSIDTRAAEVVLTEDERALLIEALS